MMDMLLIKEKVKNFYAEYEQILSHIIRFLASFISMIIISQNVGYNMVLTMWPVMIVLSALFAFMPWRMIVLGLTIIMSVNVLSLSLELGIVIIVSMFIMLLLFFRFVPTQGVFVLFIPLAFFLRIPYIIPIIAGLICTPLSIVSVIFGTLIYHMVSVVGENASAIENVTADTTSSSSLNTVLNMVSGNSQMVLVICAFILTIAVVYLIRRTSINNAWIVAILVGGVMDFVIVLVGSLILNTEYSILGVILGNVVSILLAMAIQFFVFSVDYSRTEHTQFEDDEYYYYVKAVPKINVVAPEMNVKRINAQRKKKKNWNK